MRKLLTFLRGSMHTIITTAIVGVVVVYIAVHFNLTGLVVEHAFEKEIGKLLDTRVTIEGDAEVNMMNQVVLNQLTIYDHQDDTLLYARRVMVAFDIWEALSHHLVLNTCQLIDFDIRTYKQTSDSQANFQFAIDAFKRKDPDSKPFIQQVDLNAILLRQGKLSYDVKDRPMMDIGDSPIDPNHVHIQKFSANVHLHNNLLLIKKFHCEERKSQIKADRCELSLNLSKLLQSPEGSNIQIMSLKGLEIHNDQLVGKADANLTSDELTLNLRDLELKYGHPRLKGVHYLHASSDLRLTQFKNTADSIHFDADFRELYLRMDTLGLVSIYGKAQGMPCNLAFDSEVSCDLGKATLHANAEIFYARKKNFPDEESYFLVQGHCKTSNFIVGKLLPKKAELGNTAFDADFKLSQKGKADLQLALNGDISRLDWKDHTFKDIEINAEGQGKWFKGQIALSDTLGNIDASFDIDMRRSEKRYRVDGSFAHLNTNALKLTQQEMLDSLNMSGIVHADIAASTWLNAEGTVSIKDIVLEKGDKQLALEPILFEGTRNRGALTSPIAKIDYQRERTSLDYIVSGRIPVNNELLELLDLPFRTNHVADLSIAVDSTYKIRKAHAELPSLDLLNGREGAAVLDIKGNKEGALFPTLTFNASIPGHSIEGTLTGKVLTSPELQIQLNPSTLLYNKREEVKLTNAYIKRTNEGDLVVDHFTVNGKSQSLFASGTLGQNGDKSFMVNLDNFDITPICSSFNKGYLKFGGNVSGNIVVNSNPQLQLTADSLRIRNFAYIDTLLGDACLNVDYHIPNKKISIIGDIETHNQYHTHIDGDIQTGKNDSLDLHFDTDHLPIGFLNNWTGSILQRLYGTVTGKARLYGAFSRLQIIGSPDVEAQFTHRTIGAHFRIKDKIHMTPNLIAFKNAYLDDCHGHPASFTANVKHTYLRRFRYDVNVELPDNRVGFLALDRQEAPGRIYWGKLYAAGHAHLENNNGRHQIDLNVTPTEGSCFYLSPYEQDIDPDQAAYSVLKFRDKAKMKKDSLDNGEQESVVAEMTTREERTNLRVDLNVNAKEQCEVKLKIDPLSDDMITARGNGDLSIVYDPSRDIALTGTYHITEGTYTMSMKGDVMSKTFQLQNTSNVVFDGVPSQAMLNLDCRYNIPSVNLNDLDEGITSMADLSRSTVPVDCKLNVTGPLSAPKIGFDFELKNVSDATNTFVHNVIGDDQTKEQEVLYLLLFSKFYTPQYAQSTQSRNGSSELTSLASSSITAQLNQFLSRVSNNFTMGTNVRSDKGDFSDVEMDLSVSTHLLGDRLQLWGNVGYRDPANRLGAMGNTTPFIGDFDLEWLINPSGTVRAKAYSHYNERDFTINNALTTQGIGFILRKDFKRFPLYWLFRNKKTEPAASETPKQTKQQEEK